MNKVTETRATPAGFTAAENVGVSDLAMADELSDSLYVHKFYKPFSYEGETYTQLTFDFGSLTGGDSLDVEEELQSTGHAVIMRSIDGQYLARMCAKACTANIDFDIFRAMPVRDYAKITNVAKRFF